MTADGQASRAVRADFQSPVETSIARQGMIPIETSRHAAQLHRGTRNGGDAVTGDEDLSSLAGPINWQVIPDGDCEDTFDDLAAFLAWAVPHWGFTTEQFPYTCWWQHTEIFEEMTAWWQLWQAYIANPQAHPADPMAFHERTHALKDRLATTYRGRCRDQHHATIAPPEVGVPAP